MTNTDPNLIKTPIANTTDSASLSSSSAASNVHSNGTDSKDDHSSHSDIHDINNNVISHQGTETLDTKSANTEHVNELDDPARQPDRRDQQGQTPFDDNINEDTVGSTGPISEEINDYNRYASIDNAQRRVLTPDERGLSD